MKEVCLVGFANSTREYAWELPETVPIWSLNDAFLKPFPRIDVIFDPHYLEHIKHKAYVMGIEDTRRIEWLHTNNTTPIYMLEAYPEVPMARRYPIEDVIRMVGDKDNLTSTFALMMGKAILDGYERIYVYGFNMGVDSEYIHQLPGGKYMVGFARGRGIEVIGPPESHLFERRKVYGYEGTAMITRRTLEKVQGAYKQQVDQNRDQFNKWNGILEERKKGFIKEDGRIMGNKEAIGEAFAKVRTFDTQRFAAQAVVEAFQRLINEADMIEVEPVKIEVKGITDVNSERVPDSS